MGYVPGFEYDAFISYAHNINRPFVGNRRWVSELKEDLSAALPLAPVPTIWLSEDEKIRKRRGDWWADVNSALKSSAILITINGESWADSNACRSEKDVFEAEEEDPRTASGARRIIEVAHGLVDGRSPSNLIRSDPVWFCPKPEEDQLESTFRRGDKNYEDGVVELSARVKRVLREMRSTAPAVYLNPPAVKFRYWPPESTISDLHAKLKTALGKRYKLVQDPALEASLSIHVVGTYNPPEVQAEYDRSLKSTDESKHSIVIVDPDLSPADAVAQRYQDRERERKNMEVYLGANKTNDELVRDVSERIGRLFPRRIRQTKVYVICSSNSDRATPRFKYLEEMLRDKAHDPGNKLTFHEGPFTPKQKDFYSRCDGAILVWQGGNSQWFVPQHEEMGNSGSVRPPGQPIAANGVCLMQPEPTQDDVQKAQFFSQLRNPPTPNFYLIDDLVPDDAVWHASVENFLQPLRDRRQI